MMLKVLLEMVFTRREFLNAGANILVTRSQKAMPMKSLVKGR